MSKFTRRVFLKRSGTATLGSVLGLGLLPSLTRKLHATDESGDPTEARLTCDLDTLSQSWAYMGGTLSLSIVLSPSLGSGVCGSAPVMTVTRTATYVKETKVVTYSAAFSEVSDVTWQCIGGVVTATSVTHPVPPSGPDVAIANVDNAKETIGTLGVTGSSPTDPAVTISATVLIGDEFVTHDLGPLAYAASCC